MNWDKFGGQMLMAVSAVAIGLVFFALAFFVINKALPFSMRKEIEEDQNTSLAIMVGSVILGIAIIIAAAIHGS